MSRVQTMLLDLQNDDNSAVDSELVPTSLASIIPILRVANEIEQENLAYLWAASMHWRRLIGWIQHQVDMVSDRLRLIWEEMAKDLQIAAVLYDVLTTVVALERVDDQIQRSAEDVKRK